MSPLVLIVVGGFAMAVIALVGSLTLLLPVRTLERMLTPLIALAAGSLVGGALFHLLPESIGQLGNTLSVYAWLVGGFAAGNFLYIGAADLLPQLAHEQATRKKLEQNLFFVTGLTVLLLLASLD